MDCNCCDLLLNLLLTMIAVPVYIAERQHQFGNQHKGNRLTIAV